LLTDVLEHVADDFAMFSELVAPLEPGAYLLVTVPADLALWSEHDRAFGHYRRYDNERLVQIWQGLPVRPVFVSHFNARLYPIVKLVRRWNRLSGRAVGEFGTDFRMPRRFVNSALRQCFAGERRRLVQLARGQTATPYRRGVSLMALLERRPGAVEPRSKPSGVAADYFDPMAELQAAEL
jgi:hypothetical protein